MNSLNAFIDTAQQFTAPHDAMPVVDRNPHINVGLEIAQRAAQQQQAQQQEPAPVRMTPITPVAN